MESICKTLGYTFDRSTVYDGEPIWTLAHNNRIEITRTKHGAYRVWDTRKTDTVSIEDTLSEAKEKAATYYQVSC